MEKVKKTIKQGVITYVDKEITVYVAKDGKEFSNEELCKQYESELDSKNIEYKPCPKCNAPGEKIEVIDVPDDYYEDCKAIRCQVCWITTDAFSSVRSAQANWNDRRDYTELLNIK